MKRFNNYKKLRNVRESSNRLAYPRYKTEGYYFKWEVTRKGLVMSLADDIDEDNLEELHDCLKKWKGASDSKLYDFMEYEMGNSELRFYDNLGEADFGMTDAPGVTIGYYDGDEWNDSTMDLYYLSDYVRFSVLELLLKNGSVTFQS